ncbi:hypothetical protein GCM10010398_08260 [Streptomyces fimbriatus]
MHGMLGALGPVARTKATVIARVPPGELEATAAEPVLHICAVIPKDPVATFTCGCGHHFPRLLPGRSGTME